MRKQDCQDCICLTLQYGKWYCDECEEPIEEIKKCPEEVL